MRRCHLALLAAFVLSSGCSDPHSATAANFKRAIEPMMRDAFCRPIGGSRLVLTAAGDDAIWPLAKRAGGSADLAFDEIYAQRRLDAAAVAGLLTRTERTTAARQAGGSDPLTQRRIVIYDVTDKGQPYYRETPTKIAGELTPWPSECTATGELIEIVRWTDPADAFGMTLSQVTVRYRGVDIAGSVSPSDRAAIGRPREERITLARANDGWRRPDR